MSSLLLHPAFFGEQCHLYWIPLWSLTCFVLIANPKHFTVRVAMKKIHHGQSQYRCRDPVTHHPYSPVFLHSLWGCKILIAFFVKVNVWWYYPASSCLHLRCSNSSIQCCVEEVCKKIMWASLILVLLSDCFPLQRTELTSLVDVHCLGNHCLWRTWANS